jgi:hypothetical protein
VLSSAKKLNKKINKELDRAARGEEDEPAEEADGYNAAEDTLAVDTVSYSPAQLSQAYQMVHDRGLPAGGSQGMGGQAGSGRVGPGIGSGRGRGPH